MSNTLSILDAIKIQTDQVIGWKPKLSPECYSALIKFCHAENAKLIEKANSDPLDWTGYDVIRGDGLYGFIANWKPAPLPQGKPVPKDIQASNGYPIYNNNAQIFTNFRKAYPCRILRIHGGHIFYKSEALARLSDDASAAHLLIEAGYYRVTDREFSPKAPKVRKS